MKVSAKKISEKNEEKLDEKIKAVKENRKHT